MLKRCALLLLVSVISLYGLSLAPEEMPDWLPLASGVFLVVVMCAAGWLVHDTARMRHDPTRKEPDDLT